MGWMCVGKRKKRMNERGMRRAEGGKEGQVECVLLVMSWIGDEGFIPG